LIKEKPSLNERISRLERSNRILVAALGGVALHGPEGKGTAVLYLKGEGSLRFFGAAGNVTDQFPAPAAEFAE
jgi:hypothetical protein